MIHNHYEIKMFFFPASDRYIQVGWLTSPNEEVSDDQCNPESPLK